jgi:hypothetical protein
LPKTLFGQFTAPTPKTPEQKLEERILTAFEQGFAAARKGKHKSANHYMPSSQEEQWLAWNLGYEECSR